MFARFAEKRVRASANIVLFVICSTRPVAAQPSGGAAAPLTAFDSVKVHALLRERLPCLGCHTDHGTGGTIGPDLTHVANRRTSAYIAAMIENPQKVVPGAAMPRIAMPLAMRVLVTRYFAGGAPLDATPATGSARAIVIRAPTNGAALYARYCAACHGEQGGGDGVNARHLPVRPAVHANAALMSTKSDARLFDAIAVGGYPMGRSVMMPPFGETLSREEIWLLVRHLRTLCRCTGPAWSASAGGAAR